MTWAAPAHGAPAHGAPAHGATAPGIVVPVSGAPLRDLVISSAGVVFASNPTDNVVDVLDLSNDTLEPPIAVGKGPAGLDLSPDGSTLYVADEGSAQISVVDVGSRHEKSRISLPPVQAGWPSPAPVAVAVAANGRLLVSTDTDTNGAVLDLDLTTGAVVVLTFPVFPAALARSADRSHIGVLVGGFSTNDVWIYTAATDSLSAEGYVGPWVVDVAMNPTGSQLMAGQYLLDDSLTVTGTLSTISAGQGEGIAFAPTGSTAYSITGSQVNVIDTSRQLQTATLTLPETTGQYNGAPAAVSPDGTTLVVATASGFSVVPVSAAQPVPACTPWVTGSPSGPLVVHVCGGPLGAVVADRAGHVFASNPALNEIEVLDLSTGTLEAPIPVGSDPGALALSADQYTLYAADTGGGQMSVVDVAKRSETGRIDAIPNTFEGDTAYDVALADNGEALVSTSYAGYGTAPPLYEVDLRTGKTRLRTAGSAEGNGTGTELAASADGSTIAVEPSDSGIYFYNAATDSFGNPQGMGHLGGDVAVNHDGTRVLVNDSNFSPNPTTPELNAGLQQVAAIPGAGSGIMIAPGDATAYRVNDTRVDVISMANAAVVGAVPLPEAVGVSSGAVARSADGNHLAVLTQSGISVVLSTPNLQTKPHLAAVASPVTGIPTITVSDTATLSGSTNATGTITFSLWGPSSTPDVVCSGTARFQATTRVTGDGTYNSGGFSDVWPGYYAWVAQYSGDRSNAVAVTSCGGAGSSVSIGIPHLTMTVTPSVTTGTFPLVVTFTYKVTNDGDDPLTQLAVADTACGSAPFKSGPGGPAGYLQPGAAWLFSCSHMFTDPGPVTGTATATATDQYTTPGPVTTTATASDRVQVVCGRTLTGTIAGNLSLGPGATCLEGAKVHGSVSVSPGGALYVDNSTVYGEVGAVEAVDVTMCASAITGDVVLEYGLGPVALGHPGAAGNPIAPPCPGDAIGSWVYALDNGAGFEMTGDIVDNSAIVYGTSGGLGTQLAGNTIAGSLWCAANNPTPDNGARPNTVYGARYGQCANRSF